MREFAAAYVTALLLTAAGVFAGVTWLYHRIGGTA